MVVSPSWSSAHDMGGCVMVTGRVSFPNKVGPTQRAATVCAVRGKENKHDPCRLIQAVVGKPEGNYTTTHHGHIKGPLALRTVMILPAVLQVGQPARWWCSWPSLRRHGCEPW